MRNTIYFIVIISLFIFFTACNKDLITVNLENESDGHSEKKEIVTSENAKITLDVAKKIAMQFMHKNSNSELRSGEDNKMLYTECFIEDNDTLMYLLNFENGFVLVSGSSVTNPVLGFADQNNLYENDIKNNPDLSFWFEYVKGQIKETLNDTIIEYYDPLGWEDITDNSETRSGVGESGHVSGRVGEELCLIKTNWGQGPPFNNSTPNVGSDYSNGNAPAGCVAIAIGQILFYHKHMYRYNYDWNKLGDPYNNPLEIGNFIRTIGDGVSMVYKKDGSYPKVLTKLNLYPGPKDYFEKIGYNVKSSNFSLQEIASQIDKKNPVYISGYEDTDFLNAPNIFKGHAWVCDAYVKRKLENNSNGRSSGGGGNRRSRDSMSSDSGRSEGSTSGRGTRTSSTVYIYYLHFNWGWNGSHNGWFSDGKSRWAYDNPPQLNNDNSPESTDPMRSNRFPRLLKTLSIEKK